MRYALLTALWVLVASPISALADGSTSARGDLVSLVVKDAPVAEVFEMLSRQERVNILVADTVKGKVSLNLFDVGLDQAIHSAAEAAGYLAERRGPRTFAIVSRKDAGKDSPGATIVRALRVQYSDAEAVAGILKGHLSRYGSITSLPERHLLVVEDMPGFVQRASAVLAELDRQPQQILIEAKVYEITLDDGDFFGVDWQKFFTWDDGNGAFGVQNLVSRAAPGVFFEVLNDNIDAFINLLAEEDRVRALATPSLLALENEEAEVIIGDRLGFRVTTTINQVTTESVEFLESGVILRFTASVDGRGRVVLDVHPEVSTGFLNDGIPNQTTTEVTTRLLLDDGDRVFMGGLIRERRTESRTGFPWVRDVPLLRKIFWRAEDRSIRTETVVLISARVQPDRQQILVEEKTQWVPRYEEQNTERREHMLERFDLNEPEPEPGQPAAVEQREPNEP